VRTSVTTTTLPRGKIFWMFPVHQSTPRTGPAAGVAVDAPEASWPYSGAWAAYSFESVWAVATPVASIPAAAWKSFTAWVVRVW